MPTGTGGLRVEDLGAGRFGALGLGGQEMLEGVPWVPPQVGHCAVLLCPLGDGWCQQRWGWRQVTLTAPRHCRPQKHISKAGSRAKEVLAKVSSSIHSPETGNIVHKSLRQDEVIQWCEEQFQWTQSLSSVCDSVLHPDKELPHRLEKKLWQPPNTSSEENREACILCSLSTASVVF